MLSSSQPLGDAGLVEAFAVRRDFDARLAVWDALHAYGDFHEAGKLTRPPAP